jgi:anti-sigma factor RsiW
MAARLSSEEMAELAALADGSLPAERRAEVEARVAASPELRELLERQRRAVLAAQTLAAEEVPASLQATVEARRRALAAGRGRARRLGPRIVLAGAAAVTAAVLGAIVLSGGPAAPTLADAARLATQAPTAPAPPPESKTRLAIAVQGIAFPNLARYGWHALGVRRDRIDGRDATVVFYGADGRRLGYVIVEGAGLARPSGAEATWIGRVEYRTLRLEGRLAVTWRRGGHTCVLLGQATRRELLKLASWPLSLR